MRKLLSVVLLIATLAPVWAQSEDEPIEPIVVEGAEPYSADEFPEWLIDLRRAEIVAIGSIPFTMLASSLFYSLGRYVFFSAQAGESRPEYLPALFAPPGAVPFDSDDNVNVVLGAIGLSLVVATIDFLFGLADDGTEP